MKKKGELTLQYIIMMILGLMALIIIAIIFREQIGNFVATIKGTSSGIDTQIIEATDGLTP